VTLIASFTAWKINKLHPLTALRGGIATHSFRKNLIPLDTARGPLGFLLALKLALRNTKQTIAISLIIAAVTMASVAGIALNHNMSGGQDNFAKSLLGEMPDVNFILKDGDNGEAFKARLLERPEVRKSFGYETSIQILVDEHSIVVSVVEDCSLLESSMIIDGRYPRHDNEIAIGTTISKVAGKNIGDKVAVKSGQTEKEYIVTGIAQFMQSNGFNGIITGDGLAQVQPDFMFKGYNAYLTEGADAKTFIKSVEASEGDAIDSVMDLQDQLSVLMDSMSALFSAVTAGIAAVTAFVVILVLYMVIRTTILRRRRELGIQKAIGFTTFQLMNQIALSMAPVVLLGTAAGAVWGYFGLNPMVAALTSSMGIVKVRLPVPIDQTLLICFALVVLAYAVSLLIAWRIRKISAYLLISE
jgi:putative ABC transport system permease protein